MTTAVIVPARLGSTRFPRKMLHPVEGKPLILWTAERIRQQAPDVPLHFAVAERALAEVVGEAGFSAVLTSADHPNGTSRIAEANATIGADRVVNIQADEPLVTGQQIRRLSELLAEPDTVMSTLGRPFSAARDFMDPNQVKVVIGAGSRALYFSRSPIPFNRDTGGFTPGACFLHLGMYGYTGDFLQRYPTLSRGRLEELEKLEQLRVLEHGYTIRIGITEEPTLGVDTPADADTLAQLLRGGLK
ncbi:MAG: 3-deoxy-manno-octulosonate cytidylyltransferase [Opitutales bacterium]